MDIISYFCPQLLYYTHLNYMRMKYLQIIKMMVAFLILGASVAQANDAVFFVNGSHLQPLQETDIAIKSEVLTITLKDDGFAYVEVDYQFMNNGEAKDVTMGFEASSPYNSGDEVKLNGAHPNINDFSVVMNGKALSYRNGLVFSSNDLPEEETKAGKGKYGFVPIDFSKWKYDEENSERFYNAKTDEYANFSYAYYFDAHFNKGLNTVKHTYAYRMSFGVGKAFEVPYWLLPAMRWANHQIDDFTLRIKTDNCTKHFIIENTPFKGAPFRVTQGKGKTRELSVKDFDDSSYKVTEVVLRNGTLEWHRNNFRTDSDMEILSADQLEYLYDWGNAPVPVYHDSGVNYMTWMSWVGDFDKYFPGEGSEQKIKQFAARVQRNLPYAHRGYVFKDAKLRKFFESQWWYMPDPTWKPTDSSFRKHEWDIINQKEE